MLQCLVFGQGNIWSWDVCSEFGAQLSPVAPSNCNTHSSNTPVNHFGSWGKPGENSRWGLQLLVGKRFVYPPA